MPNNALTDSFIDSLVKALGRENVLTDPYDLDRYSGDALSPSRAFGAEDSFERLADVVARPGSTEDVRAVLKLARKGTRQFHPMWGCGQSGQSRRGGGKSDH